MIWSVLITLLMLWLLGVLTGVGGQLIHGLLALILLVVLVRYMQRGRVE